MPPSAIKSGTYKLTQDVKNPCADRRFKDMWTAASKFPAGLELIVDNRSYPVTEDRSVEIPTIRAVKHRHDKISVDSAAFEPLVAAMEPIPESPAAMFRRLDVESLHSFCLWLVETGKMTADAFEALYTEWINSTEE